MKSPKKSLLTQPSALFPRHKAFKALLPETPALGGQNDTGQAAGTRVVAEMLEYLKYTRCLSHIQLLRLLLASPPKTPQLH